MSPRPGTKSRSAGCFLTFFFGIFALFGGLGAVGLLNADSPPEGNPTAALIVCIVFLLIGIIGMFFGIRMFRRSGNVAAGAAPAGSAASSTVSRRSGAPSVTGPGLPAFKKHQRLANGYYRFDPESSHVAMFWILTFAALLWNGITWVFAGPAYFGNNPSNDTPKWFISIFVIVGVILIYAAVKSFLRWMMVGETHLDVNADFVTPGQRIEIMISQPKNFKIDQLKVDFICRESATYQAGTDTRTKEQVVQTVPICELQNLTARDGQVLACQTAVVPPDAMPSFESSNNKITWFIQLKMVLPGRPDVDQCFPIQVVAPQLLSQEGR